MSPPLRWLVLFLALISMSAWVGASEPRAVSGEPLRIRNLGPGEFLLGAQAPLRIRSQAWIEASPNQRWPYRLSNRCGEERNARDPCLLMARGARFQPIPWNGTSCSDPCDRGCEPLRLPEKPMRLQVSLCSPGARTEGAPFIMPPAPAMLPRWRAAAGVVRAWIARLQKGRRVLGGRDRIAGLPIVPHSERPLDPRQFSRFVAWLQAEDGFLDHRARRCRPEPEIGIRFSQGFGEGVERVSEIALDFHCKSMSIFTETPRGWEESYTLFDPSEARLRTLIRDALD